MVKAAGPDLEWTGPVQRRSARTAVHKPWQPQATADGSIVSPTYPQYAPIGGAGLSHLYDRVLAGTLSPHAAGRAGWRPGPAMQPGRYQVR